MHTKLTITKWKKIVLLLGDIFCFVAGLIFALIWRFGFSELNNQWQLHRAPFFIIFFIWLIAFYIAGLYTLPKAKNSRSFFALLFGVFFFNALSAIFIFYFLPYFFISPKVVLFLNLAVTFVLIVIWRAVFNGFSILPQLKLALVGTGVEIDELINDINKHPQNGYKCVLHIKNENESVNLDNKLKELDVDVVVVAIDYRHSPELQKGLFKCIPLHIQFFDFVDFYEQYFQRVPLAVIDRAWFLENINETSKLFVSQLKRFLDLIMAFLLGIIGLVLFPFIATALLLTMGRPLFFIQSRVGQFEKSFRIIKFRSYGSEGNDNTVTRFGNFLRKSHLDEMPQLWNIIKGEMSFVGPRPEQVKIVAEFKNKIPFYTERLLVRPGIAGWAQLHQPKARAEDALHKLQYDLFYIKHRSLLFDLEIILKTLRILLA